MGKGIVADSSPYNYSAARSTAFKEADVVLVLGARLNWILAFGLPPKWSATVKIVQVDICADELGKNGGDPALSLLGDVGATVQQILGHLGDWQWKGNNSLFLQSLDAAQANNRKKAAKKASVVKSPMMFDQAFNIIKSTLDKLSVRDIVYVSEGANAMDISRSIFTMEHPRTRLDAGTYATMGVGLGYAVAAYAAYNFPRPEGVAGKAERKKIVCIEGDSAFGFSGMEVETMARYDMDVLIFIMNNNGLYRGDTDSAEQYNQRRKNTIAGSTTEGKGLTAWSLGYQTNYHKIAEMAGGIGFEARTPEELKEATEKGYHARVPVVINVIINSNADLPMVSIVQQYYAYTNTYGVLGLLLARYGPSKSGEAKALDIQMTPNSDISNHRMLKPCDYPIPCHAHLAPLITTAMLWNWIMKSVYIMYSWQP
jgi:2-hydroxyacyl-CoA lyase 1